MNIGVRFSGGCFIHVTRFDVTVGETSENMSGNNKIIIPA